MQFDFFSEATVTLNDVELWLRCTPRFTDNDAPTRVLHYAQNYDVVNKIMRAKVNGTFDNLTADKGESLYNNLLPLIAPKYHPCTFMPYYEHKRRERLAAKAVKV